MKILLLEDDAMLNEIMFEHLEKNKHEVISSCCAIQVEKMLHEQNFDLLIIDVNVSNINGCNLLKTLRDQDRQTPAIFITSTTMFQDTKKDINSPCNDYLKKPFELKDLDARIKKIQILSNVA